MLYTFLFLILTYYILSHSQIALHYAFQGFTLWYSKMIPALVPFMILSGTVIRMNLTEKFVAMVHPVMKRIYKCSPNVSYGLIIGFLCGFPMGARVCSDLLKNGKITQKEAEFLLAFNNNIGPVYFSGFVLPLLEVVPIWPFLLGMYGIPALYGIILRYTKFKDMYHCEIKTLQPEKNVQELSVLSALDESIYGAVQSILMLCGYMIFFNTLNILPHFWLSEFTKWIAPVLEITGGLALLDKSLPFYSLCMLQFGGLSCIAQTNSMIKGSGLSIKDYIFNKINITGLAAIYYFFLFHFL